MLRTRLWAMSCTYASSRLLNNGWRKNEISGMSRKKRSFGLFEAYGVELEYMIVDRTTLAVRPLADWLFHDVAGKPAPTLNRGTISWSNELVNHVIEFKVTKPVRSLEGISTLFQENV